eukprot:CAMPEP_0169170526 /NCGR_PEP_ID=MMETSP1015-20121227/62203_1 /TAXON_ID=342587 /ORGANISM="Karlodinium micrum, Strain CCMP2283" /LENGTH=148 /DNA_ID=CAMNT_0009243611 /DNA_START=643 /DNA_END=1089 /DNA_ORIENTATION=-
MRQDLLLSDDRRFTPESTADLGRAAVFAAMLPPSCQDLMRDEDGNSIHLSERFCFRKAKPRIRKSATSLPSSSSIPCRQAKAATLCHAIRARSVVNPMCKRAYAWIFAWAKVRMVALQSPLSDSASDKCSRACVSNKTSSCCLRLQDS